VDSEIEEKSLYGEDLKRLEVILAARKIDSREFFGRYASRWESVRSELFGDAFLLPTLLRLLPQNLVVADLGCGTGNTLQALAPVVQRVIGVDREPAMLEVARKAAGAHKNVDLRCGGMNDLPLSDGEADVVLCMLVLHHVEDLEGAFREVVRVCAPGGRVVVMDMIAHTRTDYRHTMGHVHLGFEERALHEVMEQAGLQINGRMELERCPDALGPGLFITVGRRD